MESRLRVAVSVAATDVVRFLPPRSVRVSLFVIESDPESPAIVKVDMSVPQITPPDAFVSKSTQEGSPKLNPPAVIERPPANVLVPDPVRLIIPLDKIMPSVIASPPDDERPAVEIPPEKVEEAAAVLLKITDELNTPPVRVSPSEETNPPVPTDKPVANVEVPARI